MRLYKYCGAKCRAPFLLVGESKFSENFGIGPLVLRIKEVSSPSEITPPNSWIWKPCGVEGRTPEMFINIVVGPPIGWKEKETKQLQNQTQ